MKPPIVQLLGDVCHPDFRDAIGMLLAEGEIADTAVKSPELIVIAQSRPGAIHANRIEALRRAAPLAGIVALVGSWCEGETRTGHPWPGVERLYWYEFPAWWRRQLALRAAGRCPDWARPEHSRLRTLARDPIVGAPRHGLVILRALHRDAASALADVLHRAGFATAWQSKNGSSNTIRGAAVGIWDGGQLNDCEAEDLSRFCGQLARGAAPVIATLDFPRRDSADWAQELGAAVVLGKPWINAELVETLQSVFERKRIARAA